jgi:hypothetical protein
MVHPSPLLKLVEVILNTLIHLIAESILHSLVIVFLRRSLILLFLCLVRLLLTSSTMSALSYYLGLLSARGIFS